MEIQNSLKHDFVKFIYEFFDGINIIGSIEIIGMNSKDFKTELGGQQDINFLINKSMSACQK